MHMRLRCFDRRLDTCIKAFLSVQSLSQGPCKARKPSRASRIQLCQGKNQFGRATTPFGQMAEASGEWLLELKEMCLDLLETPNGAPFGRMHLQFSRIQAPDCATSILRKPNSEGFWAFYPFFFLA